MSNLDNLRDWKHVKRRIARHALTRKDPAATPWEGLVLGNADMGAIVFGPGYKLHFRLNKMDLWDARMNVENLVKPLPLSKFKEYIFRESKKMKPGDAIFGDLDYSWKKGKESIYPCMRMGADFLVRIIRSAGTFPAPIRQRLRLEDALYEASFVTSWWPHIKADITLKAFISWQHNVLAIKIEMPEHALYKTIVSLARDSWGARSWELLSSGQAIKGVKPAPFNRDPRVGMLPPAQINLEGNLATLWQVIPGDEYCPERGFSVAAVCKEGAEFFMEPSGQAIIEALDHDHLTLFVALASEMEAPDSMKRARALAKAAADEGWDALYEKHSSAWRDYWMKSALELADRNLDRQWTRSLYNLAVSARSGRPSPGLMGVSTVNDHPPWSGDRHNDYPEFSLYFWSAFASNHAGQALNYTEFVYNYLPTARRIAREVYECEKGAMYPVCYIDGSELYWFHPTWARILWLTAVHAQNCWWHYQYFGDLEFLRKLAYPVMKECANFYVEMVGKNPPGDYTFWPTIACEIRGWTKDFELNKNCIEDLAHIKFLMRAVIEASRILDVDEDERKSWQDILNNLAPYPTIVIDGKEEFVDFAGQDKRPEYNHSVPLAPLWPAEDPDVYTNPDLRRIAENTLAARDWDRIRHLIACMRLGMKEKVCHMLLGQKVQPCDESNAGFLSTAEAFLINEMLITSWDGIVRIFPSWPLDKKARFRDLRTKGAFLVSAACEKGAVQELSIRSEKGNPVRLLAPWPVTNVFCETSNEIVDAKTSDGIIAFNTSPGHVYSLRP